MTENAEIIKDAVPQAEENFKAENDADTIPQKAEEIVIPVKFNKEVKELTLLRATELAQKGMKFELIIEDYERIKKMSEGFGKSVTEFLNSIENELEDKRRKELSQKCGGDEALAQHILELENGINSKRENGIEEIKKYFPEIKEENDLPDSVLEAAHLKGTLLLDEYLRYLLNEKQRLKEMAKIQKKAVNASVGSQLNHKNPITPEAAEFLKGLWK